MDSASGETIAVESPGNRRTIASVPRGQCRGCRSRRQGGEAKAFPAWSKVVPRERGRMLQKIADAVEARVEELARIIAEETGNAIRTQARPEAKGAADILRYFGGLASELKGETIPLGEHVLSYTRREPIGVVGAIIPWNAPVMLGALKIAPALCAGNTLVLKAAEDAPLGVLWIAAIAQELLPKGVLNVVTGYGEEAGAALSAHPGVRKLSFTGSTEVGKLIMRAAADRIVPVSLELGGKSPSIVYPDANEDWVVDGIIAAMRFTRQSQSCTAGSRLFLHADIFDSFLGKLAEKTQKLKIGDPLDEASDIGAIINEKQFKKVCGYVEEGMKQPGAKMLFGGLPPKTGPAVAGLLRHPHRVRQRRQRLAARARGDLRPGAGGDPLDRRGRGHPHGQRHPLRPRRLRVDPRHRPRSAGRARHRGRLGAGEPGPRPVARPFLRRHQAVRHRPRVLAGRHARQLHAAEERDGEFGGVGVPWCGAVAAGAQKQKGDSMSKDSLLRTDRRHVSVGACCASSSPTARDKTGLHRLILARPGALDHRVERSTAASSSARTDRPDPSAPTSGTSPSWRRCAGRTGRRDRGAAGRLRHAVVGLMFRPCPRTSGRACDRVFYGVAGWSPASSSSLSGLARGCLTLAFAWWTGRSAEDIVRQPATIELLLPLVLFLLPGLSGGLAYWAAAGRKAGRN